MLVKTVKYKNGLTLVLKNCRNNLISAIAVFIKVGSINETTFQSGLSHFLEHLMFKGSNNYLGNSMSRNVENMGGCINAVTTKGYTMYYISAQKNKIEKCIEMLADTIQNPLFSQDEIDKEKKVVIEEIKRYLDNPESMLYEKFYNTIYTKSTLKNSVIGKSQIIANISRKELYNYYKTYYVPGNIIVVAVGNFNEIKVKKLVGETFGKFYEQSLPIEPLIVENIHNGEDIIEYGNVEIGYMLSGFLGPNLSETDMYIADIAVNILGEGRTSKLYKFLYEKKHLVFSIDAFFMIERGTGNVCIMSLFDPKNIEEVKNEIKNQIQGIIENGVTQKELNRAKLSIKMNLSLSFETSIDIAERLGYWYLMGNPSFVTKYVQKLEKITIEDIIHFFKKYYSSKLISNIALLPKLDIYNNEIYSEKKNDK
ncbi:MAG: insulinase family protein [Endomicrobium sp.]|jgi:predicted Zn-dependent peptidase|nr:insulinase family protein [Endomicrobium sp.]